jgi:hypothetical protein
MSGITDLWRTGRGCCLAIIALALLLLLGACVALGWGAAKWTQAAGDPGLDVMLLIDQSDSLWELGGVGTDPTLLRMEAARLFAATLGVDGTAAHYRLGAVYFGSQPRLVATLTPLTGQDSDRQALLATLAADPQPMGWTDINAALMLAHQELFTSERAEPDRVKAIVLLTDGRPQTEALTTPAATQAYLDALRSQIQMFSNQGAVVYAVLLRNELSDADPMMRDVYRPMWVGLAEAGQGVTFYDARSSQDLAPIYHDIVAQLHRSNSQGLVVQETVQDRLEATAEVAEGWQTATFVVHKSAPDLKVTLVQPDGRVLMADESGVRFDGQLTNRYETWSIDWPEPGLWRVQVAGRGAVAVWLDYRLAPATPTATASPTRTVTPTTTRTATAWPTATPTPSPSATATALAVEAPWLEIVQPQPDASYAVGQSAAVVVSAAHMGPGSITTSLIGGDLAEPVSIVLTMTGDGEEAGVTVWNGETAPLQTTGVYTLTVAGGSELGRGVRLDAQQQVTFAATRRSAVWGWLAGIVLGLSAVVVVGSGIRRRSRPMLAGVLRVTRGPNGQTVGQSWDLSAQRHRSATLGSGGRCYVSLPGDTLLPERAALIRSALDVESGPLLVDLTSQGAVGVNGSPVTRQHELTDGDSIELGSYQLRYENLALRRLRRQAPTTRKPTDFDLDWPNAEAPPERAS